MKLSSKLKKIAAFAAAAAMMLTFSSCGKNEGSSSEQTDSVDTSAAENAAAETEILNFIPPAEGEKIAVITVKDFGEIKIKLFPDLAPTGVKNFVELAKQGYYDELIFHRVISNFMIQGNNISLQE